MARYQLILAYDGTQFAGYQRQAQGRTVQGELEAALRRLGWSGKAILSAGRTDAGTHAEGQVIAFDLDWAHSPDELCLAMNAYLPEDIAARSARLTDDDFHPRFAALGRRYRYTLYCEEVRDPLKDRYAWQVWPGLNVDLLQAAARMLDGTHDFAAFGTPPRPRSSTIRSVSQAGWVRSEGEGLIFTITANAFLYHMVRRLVFLQVQVGQGRVSLEELGEGLECQKPQMPGLAPARGLVLAEVIYPPSGSLNRDK
ncbi:MAG TPA: tRNA pseudouridine(38-40) synthase TruA [Anaerolineaceae bacterium]|nr:tRNA pseudouridine(38-40) synthase TruA [Anaerolineaceae bacterium]